MSGERNKKKKETKLEMLERMAGGWVFPETSTASEEQHMWSGALSGYKDGYEDGYWEGVTATRDVIILFLEQNIGKRRERNEGKKR
jgi:hypothetical protein